MIAAPIVALGEIHQLPADPRRMRQARQFAHLAGHLPAMIAVRKRGWRFARRDQARSAQRKSKHPSKMFGISAKGNGNGFGEDDEPENSSSGISSNIQDGIH